jgi:hypothetical protein
MIAMRKDDSNWSSDPAPLPVDLFQQWKCPVCQKAAVFASLRLDGYMMSIIK